MKRFSMDHPIAYYLSLFAFLLLAACTGASEEPPNENTPSREEQEQIIQEYMEQYDSLNTVSLDRIRRLEGQLKEGLAAEEQEAIAREITYLRELNELIVTRKDNLSVNHRKNWHFFRQEMDESLVEIEQKLDTPVD